jgi:hypothetical protein
VRREVDASVVDTVDQKDLTGEINLSNEQEIVLCPYEEDDLHIKEGIMLQINNSKEMLFYIVDNLPTKTYLPKRLYDDLF